jgi:hypothetical protein
VEYDILGEKEAGRLGEYQRLGTVKKSKQKKPEITGFFD